MTAVILMPDPLTVPVRGITTVATSTASQPYRTVHSGGTSSGGTRTGTITMASGAMPNGATGTTIARTGTITGNPPRIPNGGITGNGSLFFH